MATSKKSADEFTNSFHFGFAFFESTLDKASHNGADWQTKFFAELVKFFVFICKFCCLNKLSKCFLTNAKFIWKFFE